MSSEDLRKRLEALNGGPLAFAPPPRVEPPAPLEAVIAARPARAYAPRPTRTPKPTLKGQPHVCLEACASGEERTRGGAAYYHIDRPAADHAPWCDGVCRGMDLALIGAGAGSRRRRIRGASAGDVLFMDIETLGLAGEPLFLIGVVRLGSDGTARCRQLFARTLAEEPGVVSAFIEEAASCRLLVTFNGIGFDVPYIRGRAALHGLAYEETAVHLDMLPEARKRHKSTLPNCKLQTLEKHLCGREREGDIDGAHIPGVYQDYVRTGNAVHIATVLQHNLLDLVTTAELFVRFFGDETVFN